MTSTEIRAALAEIQHAVEVPPMDDLAFRARVRTERRRRNAGRALAAGTAAAAAVVAGFVLSPQGVTPSGHRVVQGPAASPAPAAPTPEGLAVVRLDGKLQVLQPGDAGGYGSDLHIQQVVGRTSSGGVVVIDDAARAMLVPLAADGRPGDPVPLADGQPVVNAWLDEAGTALAFVDRGDQLHLRPLGSGHDTETIALLERQTDLVATDGTSWIEDEGDRLSLRHPHSSSEVDVQGDPVSADLAGGVLAVRTTQGLELWDVGGGEPRQVVSRDGSTGALSPDGTAYAVGGDGLDVLTTDDGQTWSTRPVSLPADLSPGAIHWQDEDRFLVLATSTVRTGNLVLLDCSVALGRCDERYDDPTGTLQIATQ